MVNDIKYCLAAAQAAATRIGYKIATPPCSPAKCARGRSKEQWRSHCVTLKKL